MPKNNRVDKWRKYLTCPTIKGTQNYMRRNNPTTRYVNLILQIPHQIELDPKHVTLRTILASAKMHNGTRWIHIKEIIHPPTNQTSNTQP